MLIVIVATLMESRMGRNNTIFQTVSLGDMSQRIDDLNLINLKGGEVEWEVKAKNTIIQNGEDDALVKDIDIFYLSHNGTTITLSAPDGIYNVKKNTFLLARREGGVEIKIGQDITIKTANLAWSSDNREIYSPGKIQVQGNRFLLEGEDLKVNVESGTYEINKNIRATIWQ